jgi:hypothetical protein
MPVRLPKILLASAVVLLAGGVAYVKLCPFMAGGRDAAVIAPHRALYNMHIASVKSGGAVRGADGLMSFEWADTCDGWALNQNLALTLYHMEGNATTISSTTGTWESRDGRSYRFNMHRTSNGEDAESLEGHAELKRNGSGTAFYVQDDGEDAVDLPKGTLFPTHHTLKVLRLAAAGERVLTAPVFDGSDREGLNQISAFIGNAIPDSSPDLPALAQGGAYPVRLAFFPMKKGEAEETITPDYELTMTLLPNGVARSLLIDYGDFSVEGTLAKLEEIPRPDCH